MRNLKRIMSMLLCSAMLCGLLPAAASADEPAAQEPEVQQTEVQLTGLTHTDLFEPVEMLQFGTQGGREARHTHGLTLTEMPSGDLFAVWFSSNPSGERDANECRLIGAWLPKEEIGKENAQWSDPFEVYNLDGVPSNNPVAYVDQNGRLWVFFNIILNGQWVSAMPRYVYADPAAYEDAIDEGVSPDWHYPEQMYVTVGDTYGGQGSWNGSEYVYGEKGDRIRYITEAQMQAHPLEEDEYVKVTSRFDENDVRYITDSFVVGINNQINAAMKYLEEEKPYDDQFGLRNDTVIQSVNEGIYSTDPYKSEPSLRDGAIWRASGADNDIKTWNPAFRRMGWQTKNPPIEFTLPAGTEMSNGEISDGTAVRMLLPLYSDSLALSICAYTDDYGQSWGYSDPIAGLGNIQGTLVMKEDGTIYQYFRSGKLDGKNGRLDWKLTRSESHDYGITWENIYVEPYLRNDGGVGLDVANDGKWIMAHNQDAKANLREGSRASVTLSVSTDEGESWQSLMLDTDRQDNGSYTGKSYEYPGVLCTSDGKWVVVAYTNKGGGPADQTQYSQVMRSTMISMDELDQLLAAEMEGVPETQTLAPGSTWDLNPLVKTADGQILAGEEDVTFRTTDANVATVDASGVVTTVAEGLVKIIATSDTYGTIGECLLTVKESAPVVELDPVWDLGSDICAPVKDNGDLGDHLHGSTIVQFANGELMAAWFQGNGERDATTTRIMASRKPVGGDWGEPFVLADTPRMADINPALFVDHEDNLWLFWYPVLGGRWESSQPKYLKAEKGHYESENGFTAAPDWDWQDAIYIRVGGNFSAGADDKESEKVDQGMTDGKYNDPYTQLLSEKYAELGEYMFKAVEDGGAGVSSDFFASEYSEFVQERLDLSLGKLYSAKNAVPYARRIGWQTKDKPLEIQYEGNWRIILPLYSDTMECTIMAITDDGGKTWQFSEPIIGVANIQASMAQKDDGTIVAYMRDNGMIPQRVVTAESTDGGMTWTIGMDHQDLFDPGVGSDLIELPDGNWVFVHNDNQFGRFSLAVALSEDEGQTWTYRRHIALDTRSNSRSFHYPAVTVGVDGQIYISYTVDYAGSDGELAGYNHIRYVQIDEDWIKAGDEDKQVYTYDIITHVADGSGLTEGNVDKDALKALLPTTVKGFYTYTEALEDGKTDYVELPILWSDETLNAIKAKLDSGKFNEEIQMYYQIDVSQLPDGVTEEMLPERQPGMLLMFKR